MKILILLANGFEEIEAITVIDILRRADVVCDMVSIQEDKNVRGAHDIPVSADYTLDELLKDGNTYICDNYDALILPGGMPGTINLRDDSRVIDLILDMNNKNKIIAAICAAPSVLEKAGIIKGKKVTSYPGALKNVEETNFTDEMVTTDGKIITGKGPGAASEFAYTILEVLGKDEIVKGLREDMFF